MAEKKPTGKPCYIGRIKNTGSQIVEAPVSPGPKNKTGTVRTGTDLRAGKGK